MLFIFKRRKKGKKKKKGKEKVVLSCWKIWLVEGVNVLLMNFEL